MGTKALVAGFQGLPLQMLTSTGGRRFWNHYAERRDAAEKKKEEAAERKAQIAAEKAAARAEMEAKRAAEQAQKKQLKLAKHQQLLLQQQIKKQQKQVHGCLSAGRMHVLGGCCGVMYPTSL